MEHLIDPRQERCVYCRKDRTELIDGQKCEGGISYREFLLLEVTGPRWVWELV